MAAISGGKASWKPRVTGVVLPERMLGFVTSSSSFPSVSGHQVKFPAIATQLPEGPPSEISRTIS